MANSDVRAAMATLDAAIQALDTSALESAEFTVGKVTDSAHGLRFQLAQNVAKLKLSSTEAVDQFERLERIATGTPDRGSAVPQG